MLACASDTCTRLFESGELTQLEFLDLCARELACDGVALNVRHFPRTDSDYLAQIKKMAVDLGLAIAAVTHAEFLQGDDASMERGLAIARETGSPMIVTYVAAETAMSWSEQLERIAGATRLAKASNVTLAVRNAPGTFAATALDYKRVSKEGDSAWLRYAVDPAFLDDDGAIDAILYKAVALCAPLDSPEPVVEAFAQRYADFRGPLVLGGDGGGVPQIQNAMRRWRIAFAKRWLNRT